MTGFGAGAAEAPTARVEVEVKGVNHRFLDVKVKLPSEAAWLESEVRTRVQSMVGRARVDLVVSLVSRGAPAYSVTVNRDLIAAYLKGIADIQREFKIGGKVGIDQIVALPGAVVTQPVDRAPEGLREGVLQAVDGALVAYDAMRASEGARLADDLRSRLATIADAVETIEGEARAAPESAMRRLRERLAALIGEAGIDPARIAQEMALQADRLDVTEEVVRLRGYIAQVRGALDRPDGPVGKTLDFVMQEMNREANTISSKSDSLSVCQSAVRVKAEVEKMREQIQNLE